jgi:hypothetical protein
MKNIFLLGIVIAVAFTSCRFVEGQNIKGNGNVSTENRNVTGFTGVQTHGSIDIEVSQGDYKIVVESDQNIIPYIVTEISGTNLIVRFKEEFHGYHYSSAKVYVTAPSLNAFEIHGSGNINGKGLITDSNAMTLNVSGSGDVNLDLHSPSITTETFGSGNISLDGETKDFSSSINGSGDVHAFGLIAENVKTSVHGSGDAEVSASVKLESGIFGSGDVTYKGSPQVNTETHGSGSMRQVN